MRKSNTKLVVRRETLRALSQVNLEQVVGGYGAALFESGTGCAPHIAVPSLPRP